MGVMQCNRNGCDIILCSRYSQNYGYICEDCFNQLCNSNLSIYDFLDTDKKEYKVLNRYSEMNIEFPDTSKDSGF